MSNVMKFTILIFFSIVSGHRFKTTHDFGFVALDVLYVYTEDCGEYVAHAVNDYGEDTTKTTLRCKGMMNIYTIYHLRASQFSTLILFTFFCTSIFNSYKTPGIQNTVTKIYGAGCAENSGDGSFMAKVKFLQTLSEMFSFTCMFLIHNFLKISFTSWLHNRPIITTDIDSIFK